MQYPAKFKASKAFIEELESCEMGRYEDAMLARENNDEEDIRLSSYECVLGDFIGRHKTMIEVRNDAELVELYYALASGLIGVRGRAAKANRILDMIRDDVQKINPEIVRMFPYQTGL